MLGKLFKPEFENEKKNQYRWDHVPGVSMHHPQIDR